MKMVVGLGNPGTKYTGTRHNVGYRVVAELARRFAAGKPKKRFRAEVAEVTMEGQRVLLLCPLTYMNASGSSVQPARDFYKLDNEDLLVVCDDFNLPLARLRFRARGSSGGQRGLEDIIRRLGTDQFPRLRIGIGPLPEGWDAADYVLSCFSRDEQETIEQAIARAADAVAAWTREGIQYCMNHYNAG